MIPIGRTEHHDWNTLALISNCNDGIQSIHGRHLRVHEDHVGVTFLELANRFEPIFYFSRDDKLWVFVNDLSQ